MKKITNIEQYSKKRAVFAICICILAAAFVLVGVSLHLVSSDSEEPGIKTYRMFTIDSNIVVATMALACIPYEIDGLRNRNYHMPRWIVYCLYVGVTVVSITFIVAIFILSPFAGFKSIMFSQSNLFLHTLCPVVSIILFFFVATDHQIAPKFTLVALIPVIVYGLVYIYMCFIVGEANGGWPDHYHLNTYIPWPYSILILFVISFLVATGVRVAHNKMHTILKSEYYDYYENIDYPTIEDAICAIANSEKKYDPGDDDVIVPRRIINILLKRYDTEKSVSELCDLYIDCYFGK